MGVAHRFLMYRIRLSQIMGNCWKIIHIFVKEDWRLLAMMILAIATGAILPYVGFHFMGQVFQEVAKHQQAKVVSEPLQWAVGGAFLCGLGMALVQWRGDRSLQPFFEPQPLAVVYRQAVANGMKSAPHSSSSFCTASTTLPTVSNSSS